MLLRVGGLGLGQFSLFPVASSSIQIRFTCYIHGVAGCGGSWWVDCSGFHVFLGPFLVFCYANINNQPDSNSWDWWGTVISLVPFPFPPFFLFHDITLFQNGLLLGSQCWLVPWSLFLGQIMISRITRQALACARGVISIDSWPVSFLDWLSLYCLMVDCCFDATFIGIPSNFPFTGIVSAGKFSVW